MGVAVLAESDVERRKERNKTYHALQGIEQLC